jgi:membrane associated rhomboid family serine protease
VVTPEIGTRVDDRVAAVRDVALPDCRPWVTAALAAVLVAVFLAQVALVPPACARATYPVYCGVFVLADGNAVGGLLLLPFLHGFPLHAAVNGVMLLFFGAHSECRFGRRRLLVGFLTAAYLSTFVQILWNLGGAGSPLALGASGGVYALAVAPGVAAVLEHGRSLPDGDAPIAVIGALVFASALLGALGMLPNARQTATVAHLVGALLGAFYGSLWAAVD